MTNEPILSSALTDADLVARALTGDRDTAAVWSRVGLALLKGERGAGFARCSFIHAWFHNHWVSPLGEGIALADAGAEAGLGDNEVIYGFSTADGTRIQQWTDQDTANQQWKLRPTGDGYYELVNRNSGKYLEIPNASSTFPGVPFWRE